MPRRPVAVMRMVFSPWTRAVRKDTVRQKRHHRIPGKRWSSATVCPFTEMSERADRPFVFAYLMRILASPAVSAVTDHST
nr:hypothetical protein [Acrocarpospora phusangensis]